MNKTVDGTNEFPRHCEFVVHAQGSRGSPTIIGIFNAMLGFTTRASSSQITVSYVWDIKPKLDYPTALKVSGLYNLFSEFVAPSIHSLFPENCVVDVIVQSDETELLEILAELYRYDSSVLNIIRRCWNTELKVRQQKPVWNPLLFGKLQSIPFLSTKTKAFLLKMELDYVGDLAAADFTHLKRGLQHYQKLLKIRNRNQVFQEVERLLTLTGHTKVSELYGWRKCQDGWDPTSITVDYSVFKLEPAPKTRWFSGIFNFFTRRLFAKTVTPQKLLNG